MSTDQAEWKGEASPLLDLRSTTDSRIPPPENAAPVDVLLQQELTELNELLTHYVRMLSGPDHSGGEAVSLVAELALADSVAAAANAIRTRAERRQQLEGAATPDAAQAPDTQSDEATGTEGA